MYLFAKSFRILVIKWGVFTVSRTGLSSTFFCENCHLNQTVSEIHHSIDFRQNMFSSVDKTDVFKYQGRVGWVFPVKKKVKKIDRWSKLRILKKIPKKHRLLNHLYIKHFMSQTSFILC